MNKKKLIKFLESKGFVKAKESKKYYAIYEFFDKDTELPSDIFWIYENCFSCLCPS